MIELMIRVFIEVRITYSSQHNQLPTVIRTTHNARTGTLVPNKSVALSASACQVSLH